MKLIRKLIFLAVAMAVISTMTGCAALFNFEPPPSDKVVLGETKFSQVQKQLGSPSGGRDTKFQANGETFTVKTYLFGYGHELLHIDYTHRLRYMVDEDDVIVGEEYLSSFDDLVIVV